MPHRAPWKRTLIRLACWVVSVLTLLVGAGVTLLISQTADCNTSLFIVTSNPPTSGGGFLYTSNAASRFRLMWNKGSNGSFYCSSNAFSEVSWITSDGTFGSSNSTGSKYFDIAANSGVERYGSVYVQSPPGLDKSYLGVIQNPGAADLVVTSFVAPTTGVVGFPVSGTSQVSNLGGLTAPAFRLEYYLSQDGNVTTSDLDTGSGCNVPSLAAGASFQCSGEISIPQGPSPVAHTLGAIADSGNVVFETVKSNNIRTNDNGQILLSSPPSISSFTPASVTAGSAQFTLIVVGSGFIQGAVVQWNGAPLTTTYLSSTQLSATVPANLVATASTASIRVVEGSATSPAMPYTVSAPVQPCSFTLLPASANFAASGGNGGASVTASRSDCSWTATANVTWINFTNNNQTGSGSLTYTVSANPSGNGRTGTVTVGTATHTVNQAGTTCTYTLPSASQSFGAAGGGGSAAVQAPAGCPWTASSADSFVTITPPASGSGNGSVAYTVAANSSTAARSATLTVAGLPYTVSQAGTGATLACTGTVPSVPQAAIEGRTELLGEFVLTCTGFANSFVADIALTLNTNVTNRVTAGATDAQLTVNGGPPRNGIVAGYNTLRWGGVSIAPSGGGAVLRISKVRADASLLGTPGNLQGTGVTGRVSVAAASAVPLSGATQTMANASPSLVFSKGQPAPPTGGAQTFIPLVYQEFAAGSFEAGASRLRMVLTNVPSSVQVFAPVFPSEGTLRAQLLSADANGSGGLPVAGVAQAGGAFQQLTVAGGTATATWLVTTAGTSQVETWTFPLLVTNASTSDLNQILVSGSLAPVSTVAVASATAPVPRFRDFSVPQKLVNLRLTTTIGVGAASSPLKAGLRAAAASNQAAVSVGSNVNLVSQLVNDASDASQSATNVTIRDSLPSGLNFISCTTTGGASCTNSGNQVQVNFPVLGAGQGATVTVVAQVDPSLPSGTVVENPVSATADEVNQDLQAASASSSFIVFAGSLVAAGGAPASGGGTSQAFTYTFTHPGGYQNLDVVNILINNFLDGRNACYLAYSVPSSTLFLVADNGKAEGPYAGIVGLGNTSPIQNSQCSVVLASALGEGTTLTLTLNISFKPIFGGNRIVYVAARDQGTGNTDWQPLGVWQPPFTPPGSIAVTSVTPARGAALAGTNRQYAFTWTDSKGAGDFGVVNVLVNRFIDGRQGCYLAYLPSENKLLLVNDAGAAGGPFASMVLSGSGGIENSQCAINGSGSTVSFGPNTMTLTLNITFKSPFIGNRVIYVAGRDIADGNNTDWQAMGTWSVQ